MSLSILVLAPALLLQPPTTGDDWPGWRGPGGNGVGSGSPPIEWSAEKNIRWKAEIPGKGTSCPVVWGDLVFLTTAVSTGKKKEEPVAEGGGDDDGGERESRGERGEREGRGERSGGGRGGRGGRGGFGRGGAIEEQEFHVLAIHRKDGSIAWQKKVHTQMPHQGTHPDGSYASPTLVTDGERIVASFGSFGIYAFTLAGEQIWSKDLGDLDITNSFGEGCSPVLHGDLFLQNWDHNGDSFLVALDKKTGEERWRTAREAGTTWGTPVVIEAGGKTQIVVGDAKTIAYDAQDGSEIWSYGSGGGRGGVVTSPVHYEGIVLVSSGSRGGELRAILAAEAKGEVSDEDALLWTHAGDTPYIPSPIIYDGRAFVLKQNSGILSVYDVASGDIVYGPERMDALANAYASPVAAGGHVYFASRDGIVEVLSAGEEIHTVAVNTLEDAFDASPAIAGGELYLRGRNHLYCIAED